jgi:hypothetical protein
MLRLAGGLVALVALFGAAAPAGAQDDTTERSEGVKKVYRDYRDDGVIEACDHTRRALRRTLDELPPEADVDTPDLRPALEAAIEQVEQDDCPEPTPTPTPSPTSTPPPAFTPAPAPAPTTPPATGNDDSLGAVPPPSGNDRGGGGNPSPGSADVTPLEPEVTPVPPATTPAPAAPPAEPSGPAVTPSPVYDNPDDGVPVALLVLGGLAALLALLALLYAVLSRLGWAERPLTHVRRAWREAAFRLGGTWGDFADWMRVGR